MIDEMMLDPEMSPIVSVWSAAVPAFLATKSEVFSLAFLAGEGGGVVAEAPPLAVVGTVTVSVLPVVGSKLPTDYDTAVVVTAYADDVTPWMRLTRMLVGHALVWKFGWICMTSVVS